MMRTDAGLHADQARRHVGKACGYLATRPVCTENLNPDVVVMKSAQDRV